MYKSILIPVLLDKSRDVDGSFKAAMAMADGTAQITLLHVFEAVPSYVADYIPPDYMNSKKDAMQGALDEMAKQLPNCRGVIAEGRAGPRISRWAEENGNDCIVIASHEPAFSDILLGSVAHHVVRHAKCAVHVIR